MLENLYNSFTTQGGEKVMIETISRKDINAAWLAGALEGEGCIFAYFKKQTNPNNRDRVTLSIGASIYNTHPLFIKRVTECLVKLGISFSCVAGSRKADRPGAHVTIQGKGRTKKLFNCLMPYLASKKQQAVLVLELIAYRENLAARSQDRRGVFAKMTLEDDKVIKDFCQRIKAEKTNYPSVFEFSRKANHVFGESSTTLRYPVQ